jgi:hypothetical protein
MRRLLIATVPIVALLSGCGIAAKVQSRNEMMQSAAAYKSCLAQNAANIHACDAAREAYDADMRMYRATSAGIQPGFNRTLNVNPERPR